jgi:RNA methyltransferase, TrmH family
VSVRTVIVISKSRIAAIQSLRDRDGRRASKAFLVEGAKSGGELLESDLEVRAVFATERWVETHRYACEACRAPITTVTATELARLSFFSTPSEIVAVATIPDVSPDPTPATTGEWCVAFDDIRDPGNMGSMLRTAEWFGISHILCSESSVDVYNPKVVQSAMGSVFRVVVRYGSLPEALGRLTVGDTAVPIYGACLDGSNLYETEFPRPGVVVFGNESRGISMEVRDLLTATIRIPGPLTGDSGKSGLRGPESLNVGVAFGIFVAEIRRRFR